VASPSDTFGVFVLPLTTAFGWSRGEVSIAASFLIVGTAITAPVIGTIIDRFGARRVGISSMLALAAGYAALTQLDGRIATFYASWLLLSLIGGGTTPVVWTRTVNLWFDRGRGLALGLALAGSGVAGVFAPLATTHIIGNYGWQAGYLAIGAFIALLAVPLIALLLEDKPPLALARCNDGGNVGTRRITGTHFARQSRNRRILENCCWLLSRLGRRRRTHHQPDTAARRSRTRSHRKPHKSPAPWGSPCWSVASASAFFSIDFRGPRSPEPCSPCVPSAASP
jgi:MFS family permease